MSDKMESVMNPLYTHLECVVCFSYCESPIHLCSLGHSVCKDCGPRVHYCPTCRSLMLTKSRNWMVEAISREVFSNLSGSKTIVMGQTKRIVEAMSCSACLRFCQSPIHICILGHSVCANCRPSLKYCPMCNSPMSDKGRNWMAEEISRDCILPCMNSHRGCGEVLVCNELEAHGRSCLFARGCPVITSEFETCNWDGSIHGLKEHLIAAHPDKFDVKPIEMHILAKSKNPFSFKQRVGIYNDKFFRCIAIVNHETQILYIHTYYIGEDYKNVMVKIIFSNKEMTDQIVITRNPTSLPFPKSVPMPHIVSDANIVIPMGLLLDRYICGDHLSFRMETEMIKSEKL